MNLAFRNRQPSFPISLVLKVRFNYSKVFALTKELAVNSIRVVSGLSISGFPERLWPFAPSCAHGTVVLAVAGSETSQLSVDSCGCYLGDILRHPTSLSHAPNNRVF